MADDDPRDIDDLFAELDGDFDGDLDADVDPDELFEEMDVGDVDEDALWDALEDGELSEGDPADSAVSPDDAPETDGETAVVPKSRYCQSCEYFSEPPEIACSHDGTEIVEHVDMESFRVRNCPIVAKRRGPTDEILRNEE